MSDNTNAIQGNQSSHQGAVTETRNEAKNNWQGWWARSIIGFLLLALAWYISAQDFGFFYKILIAGGVWRLTAASEAKLSKSAEYKEVIWYWPIIVKGSAILMLILTLLHSGFGQMTDRGVTILEGEAACIADSGSDACNKYRDAQSDLDAPQLEREREAEIAEAEHDAAVELARAIALAPRHIPSSQVVDGCEQLRNVQSGLYNFVVGHPGAVNCREIEVGPNQYFDIVLDPNRSQPHCSAAYPPRHGLVYNNRPGPDRVSNTSDAFFTVVVYETPQGEDDPFGKEC